MRVRKTIYSDAATQLHLDNVMHCQRQRCIKAVYRRAVQTKNLRLLQYLRFVQEAIPISYRDYCQYYQ